MEWVHDYKHDTSLRQAFFDFTEDIFQVNFRQWYERGAWGDNFRHFS